MDVNYDSSLIFFECHYCDQKQRISKNLKYVYPGMEAEWIT